MKELSIINYEITYLNFKSIEHKDIETLREGPSAPHSTPPCPTAITSTLSLLNGSESTRLFAVSRELLPGCIRCAVVGNGGILNGSRQGQNIDAHDYVFRYVG